MTFRNDRQLAAVCRSLLDDVRLGGLWTPEGPTDLACRYRQDGGPFSSGEQIAFEVAWDLWNGGGKASVGDLLYRLDHRLRTRIGTLLLCRDAAGVDRWLAEQASAAERKGAT